MGARRAGSVDAEWASETPDGLNTPGCVARNRISIRPSDMHAIIEIANMGDLSPPEAVAPLCPLSKCRRKGETKLLLHSTK